MLGALRPIEGIWVRTHSFEAFLLRRQLGTGRGELALPYSKLSGAPKKYRSEVLPSEDTFGGKYEDTFWGKN